MPAFLSHSAAHLDASPLTCQDLMPQTSTSGIQHDSTRINKHVTMSCHFAILRISHRRHGKMCWRSGSQKNKQPSQPTILTTTGDTSKTPIDFLAELRYKRWWASITSPSVTSFAALPRKKKMKVDCSMQPWSAGDTGLRPQPSPWIAMVSHLHSCTICRWVFGRSQQTKDDVLY